MVFVYALQNDQNEEIYVGISKHPAQRLKEHNSGKTVTPKLICPGEFVTLKNNQIIPKRDTVRNILKPQPEKVF